VLQSEAIDPSQMSSPIKYFPTGQLLVLAFSLPRPFANAGCCRISLATSVRLQLLSLHGMAEAWKSNAANPSLTIHWRGMGAYPKSKNNTIQIVPTDVRQDIHTTSALDAADKGRRHVLLVPQNSPNTCPKA
jgi:hypothetical protein